MEGAIKKEEVVEEEEERASQTERRNGGTWSVRCHGNTIGSMIQ